MRLIIATMTRLITAGLIFGKQRDPKTKETNTLAHITAPATRA